MSASLTIAIPAYDRPALLAETLACLAAQSDTGFDVVVCDDLGREETRNAVARHADGRFSYVGSGGARGAVENWNRCLRAGLGEWVSVLHEDDLLAPQFVERIRPHLRESVAAVCTRTIQGEAPPPWFTPPESRARRAPDGSSEGREPASRGRVYAPRLFMKGSMTPFPGVVVRRAVAARLGGFDPRWGPLADYEFWYRLACAGPVEVLPWPGAFYRVAAGQWTERAWARMLPLSHLLRLRIVREQFAGRRSTGLWIARFFTHRNARSYARRFGQRPAALSRALALGRIPFAGIPSGWVWRVLQWMA